MDLEAKKISAIKEELRKDLEALERVERLMAKNGVPSLPDERQAVMPLSLVLPDRTEDEDGNDNAVASLKDTIEATVNAEPALRWTTQKVLVRLQQNGFPLRAKKPIYSVGQAMQKLAEAGAIKLVRKGSGNQPNIYKGKPKEQPASAQDDPLGDPGGQNGMESRVVQ